MPDIYQEVARIQTLAYELVQKYEEALNENEALRKKLLDVQRDASEQSRKLNLLEEDFRSAKIARGLTANEEDTGLARAKINTLVREIDRCIAMLNE